ncbi:uncharacterized protein LOC131145653 [Malania oleifera]|uniref:uncharacterized protein LOC131145653 n=1 Tax=Malania oleifera TaxID=397392 RepID=UPI0025ADDF05|nr:uncharacterized protein LOC131145653 [Malania oleifera]XP_057950832.1 uncharacterized protein LOC131145653 [Malania oleifera]
MMGSFSDDDKEFRFFDAQEDVLSVSSSGTDWLENSDSSNVCSDYASSDVQFCYDAWIRSPGSIQERRSKFLDRMGLSLDRNVENNTVDLYGYVGEEVDRVRKSSGAVLRTSNFVGGFCSSQSSMSCWSNDASELSKDLVLKAEFVCRTGNLDHKRECTIDELRQDGKLNKCQVGVDQLSAREDFQNSSRSSPPVHQPEQPDIVRVSNSAGEVKTKGVKKRWLSRFHSLPCIEDGQAESGSLRPVNIASIRGARAQRVKVRQSGKQMKELSALYMGQDIQAHEGSILMMKFSPDGRYLASAGEDGIVRLWQVVEDQRSNEFDIIDIDPSCIYFTVNKLSELSPLVVEKEKKGKLNQRKSSDSSCVILPQKVFRIQEKPVHEFHGHVGKILDLSWSKNNLLLSASIDKTVRLWQVGCNHCLKVFSHNNYVTCVQFNPVDDNYFISGSIDGKVRIWGTHGCQVVGWADIKEIVTAICYHPDGQGGVVGSMTGNCRFYNVSDNHMQLDAPISLHSKKKSTCKRITGLQFLPQDPSKVMVTCADSQVRILCGNSVIGKYKGVRNAGNQILASLTSDGKRIVSACEDSNVYVWNCTTQNESVPSQGKNVRSSERFSTNVSVAIPWCGLKYGDSASKSQFNLINGNSANTLFSPAHFSLNKEFLESFPKGSATWPEEKLPTSSSLPVPSTMRKSQYNFLKSSCKSTYISHAWGLVIVTAGWDGHIRSFLNYGLPVPA